jgi:malate dehydrogenase
VDDHRAKEREAMNNVHERDSIGVWGFGNVSRDVVIYLVDEELGKKIVFYGRPKEGFPDRAGAWIDDLTANSIRGPRMMGTNLVEDMAGLDVIFIGVGAPRKPGQTRKDLLAINTEVIARTTMEIRDIYKGVPEEDLPILVYMGNPVTAMTWVAYKASGFPRSKVMGQAGNLDSRRICHAVAVELGLSGSHMRGIVFGDHGDSMVMTPRYFTIGGIPLDVAIKSYSRDPKLIFEIIEKAKKGGTHFVNEVGQSASAGPAKAVGQMLRCIVTGQPEIQPVVSIIESEYGLLKKEDGLDSMSFGVPAKIGSRGVEAIIELPVDDIRDQIEHSADFIKQDIQQAASILKEKFKIE